MKKLTFTRKSLELSFIALMALTFLGSCKTDKNAPQALTIYLSTSQNGQVDNGATFEVQGTDVEERNGTELYANLPIQIVCKKKGNYAFAFTSSEPVKYTWCVGQECTLTNSYSKEGNYLNHQAIELTEGSHPLALHITMAKKEKTTNQISFTITDKDSREVYRATASVTLAL